MLTCPRVLGTRGRVCAQDFALPIQFRRKPSADSFRSCSLNLACVVFTWLMLPRCLTLFSPRAKRNLLPRDSLTCSLLPSSRQPQSRSDFLDKLKLGNGHLLERAGRAFSLLISNVRPVVQIQSLVFRIADRVAFC